MRKNRGLAQSFRNAVWGFQYFLKSQRNSRYHLLGTLFVFCLSWYVKLTQLEFIILLIAIILVWSMEIMNSSVEKLLDTVSPRYSRRAKKVKDMAAAAVLVASLGAAVIGLLILGPPLYDHLLSYR